MSTRCKYDVYIGDRLVEQVYRDDAATAAEVRRELIEHDGMPHVISVYRCALGRYAYDSMSRYTHPEEH